MVRGVENTLITVIKLPKDRNNLNYTEYRTNINNNKAK
jgi:hypothetical protein